MSSSPQTSSTNTHHTITSQPLTLATSTPTNHLAINLPPTTTIHTANNHGREPPPLQSVQFSEFGWLRSLYMLASLDGMECGYRRTWTW
ncbi:hypothetical protein Tco_0935077 [Tanacetum coccineum]